MQEKSALLVLILIIITHHSFAQNNDSTKNPSHFSGSITVTNNGISLIPTLSLGKPAVIFNLSMGKGRLSFEPELRFALEGKPWSFLFWWRYRIRTENFLLTIGMHPAINFRTEISPITGNEMIVARRYLAGELVPNYLIGKNATIGMYYLFSRGIDNGTTKFTHFLTVNTNLSNIKLTKQFYMRVIPQFYYLKLDQQDGFYFSASMNLARRNFPLSISSIINKTIDTKVTASKNFVWNVSLVWSFSKNYTKM